MEKKKENKTKEKKAVRLIGKGKEKKRNLF